MGIGKTPTRMTHLDKQQHARRLKPLKTTLDPTVYQFMLWIVNNKWYYKHISYTSRIGDWKTYFKLWK